MKIVRLYFLLTLSFLSSSAFGQDEQIDILNEVVAELIGEQDVVDIPRFSSMYEICNSPFVSCNKQNRIEGFNFQFANLNGIIPESITKLEDLVWINLEYNYLSGTIPSGLSEMKNLEELIFNGNFLEGPIPNDLKSISKNVLVDLSGNAIDSEDVRTNKRLNIINQVNLQGCRSPDSIYISNIFNDRIEPEGISIDPDDIEVEEIKENPTESEEQEDELFKVVEQMPRFPGCETMDGTPQEKEMCAKDKMLQFVYKNLKYPAIARENGLEGMCVVQFVVLENGNIGDVRLLRDASYAGRLGNSSQWIVNRMNYLCDPWIPGLQRGNPVKVLYTLPIKFKLE